MDEAYFKEFAYIKQIEDWLQSGNRKKKKKEMLQMNYLKFYKCKIKIFKHYYLNLKD